LLAWVKENRPRLAVAALTILGAYFHAGKPEQPGGAWGSFEAWSSVIRGAVVWAGLADPLKTREEAKASDNSRELLSLLIHGLIEADPDGTGLTAREIESVVAYIPDQTPSCPSLVEAASQICGPKFDSRKFAARLRRYIERPFQGRKIVSGIAHGGARRYSVERIHGDSGDSGDSDFHHSYARENFNKTPYKDGFIGSGIDSRRNLERCKPESPWSPLSPDDVPPTCYRCGESMSACQEVDGFQNFDCLKCDVLAVFNKNKNEIEFKK
jgi:hypothetical protein